ncbi:MAG: hypothetical protein U0163_06630 [Gemmatimonadaceae bacterium]
MTTPNSLMLNEFRIEKSPLPVAVTLLDSEVLVGDLFIQASARHQYEMEDASEVMNTADAFFPLRLRTGSTLLVSKGQVRDVRVSPDHMSQTNWSVAVPTPVHIRLRDGSNLEGKFMIETNAGRTRVLDYLNHWTERFVSLYRADGLVLVNVSQIVHVRQLIDATA